MIIELCQHGVVRIIRQGITVGLQSSYSISVVNFELHSELFQLVHSFGAPVYTYWCKQVHQKSRSVYANSHVGRQLKKVDTHVDIHLLLVVDVQLFIWIDRH